MTWLGLPVYTDEDVDVDLASQLLARGYDVISTRDAGNAHQGVGDESQLRFATGEGRAILTHNIGHFVKLDREWKLQGREHCGIILVERVPITVLVRRIIDHLHTYHPDEQYDTLLFLHP